MYISPAPSSAAFMNHSFLRSADNAKSSTSAMKASASGASVAIDCTSSRALASGALSRSSMYRRSSSAASLE
jgi:hypothetical protein